MPGFIRECVSALSRMYANGGTIDSPNSKALVHEFHRESDSVQSFLDDCTMRKAGARIERGKLHRRYEEYCRNNGWTALNNRSFFKNLRGKGFIDYTAADGHRYFRDMCGITAEYKTFTADFFPASDSDKAIFSRKNK